MQAVVWPALEYSPASQASHVGSTPAALATLCLYPPLHWHLVVSDEVSPEHAVPSLVIVDESHTLQAEHTVLVEAVQDVATKLPALQVEQAVQDVAVCVEPVMSVTPSEKVLPEHAVHTLSEVGEPAEAR